MMTFWRIGLLPACLLMGACGKPGATTDDEVSAAASIAPATAAPAAISGTYRNLFAELGHSAGDVQAKLRAGFEQLFHGDPENEAVYYEIGKNDHGPLANIRDINSGDVRSEGMSYGMMIAVQMDRKAEFDALWNFAKSYMENADPAHPAYGYFAWSVGAEGKRNDELPAPDGEEYFATALYFASARWGDGQGIYAYRAQADRLLTLMLHREVIKGPTANGEREAGALFDAGRAMVRFTPAISLADHTDPSYHLPAFYEVWARCGPEADRAFWPRAAGVSRDFFVMAAPPETGLSADYTHFDGSPWSVKWNPNSGHFAFDSWRTAMNWAVDWNWWAADPRQIELSDRIQAFFMDQGMESYGQVYTLDGRLILGERPGGLVATNAVASLAATHPRRPISSVSSGNSRSPGGVTAITTACST
jgi:oligosaccharide reducing-end xylanase